MSSSSGGRAKTIFSALTERLSSIAFICGCGHTGTSLVANILASHPDIYVPLRETSAFRGTDEQCLKKVEGLLREAVDTGRPVLVEKTPKHIHHLERIRSWITGAKLIMPVRDGRDVVASLKERDDHSNPQPGEARWITETSIIAAQAHMEDTIIFRYEDLIEDPYSVIRRICQHIGVTYNPVVMKYHESPRMWFGESALRPDASPTGEADQKARRNWQINQPIMDRRGRWHRIVTGADFPNLLSGEGERLMKLFGYL